MFNEIIYSEDEERKNNIIANLHNLDHAGTRATHCRVRETYANITLKDVEECLSRCLNCIRETPVRQITTIRPILPHFPRERLIVDTVDFSAYEQHNNGKRYVFTMIDSFSKYAWAYPSERKDSISFADILKDHIYNEGIWKLFHSDNGGEFANNLVENLLNNYNISCVRGRPYHPQSQGQIKL